MLNGRVIKTSISLPPESVMQLDYLVRAWHMPPSVKRSQVIQHAIWQAYTDMLCADNKVIVDSDKVDDYIV